MVDAMVLGGLRPCEVLGLRLEDLSASERRLEGKVGRQRPVSARFFSAVGASADRAVGRGLARAPRLDSPSTPSSMSGSAGLMLVCRPCV